jgi:hypothetical protein
MEKGIKLIGAKFIKMEAVRNPEFSGKAPMSNDIKILSMDRVKDMKETLKVHYSYKVDYTGLGHVLLEGYLFITSDSKVIKAIQKTFDDKNFESPEQLAITNLIVQKASVKAVALEDEFGLPIHLRLPLITLKK